MGNGVYYFSFFLFLATCARLSWPHPAFQSTLNSCIRVNNGSMGHWSIRHMGQFLADRTNGRAIGTMLRLYVAVVVCRLSVTWSNVAKRCVLEQILTAYRKSYMRKRLVPKWITLTFDWRWFKVTLTNAALIAPKLLELKTSNSVHGFVHCESKNWATFYGL